MLHILVIIGVGGDGWGAAALPSRIEVHFIRAISSAKTIFPKYTCNIIGLDNNSFGKNIIDSGRQFCSPLALKPPYAHACNSRDCFYAVKY